MHIHNYYLKTSAPKNTKQTPTKFETISGSHSLRMRKSAAPSFPPPTTERAAVGPVGWSSLASGALPCIWKRQRFVALHQGISPLSSASSDQVTSPHSSMSKKSEKPAEGKEPENSWKDVIYNPRTGEFFGRTASNWGELTQTL